MATFPGSLAFFAGFTATHTLAQDNHAAQHNLEQAEILAVQTKVGIDGSADANSLTYKMAAVETTNSNQDSEIAALFNDITTLMANVSSLLASLATKASLTGTETLTNKTLVTPIIASFINALHNHQNNAGGGQLDFGALLSNIFGSQVQTQANAGSAGGTMYFINLGGIKILWGESANNAVGQGGATLGITFPTSFFTTLQAIIYSPAFVGTSANQWAVGISQAASAVSFNIHSDTNGSSQITGFIAIGT